jgi:hypothetical protein
MNTDIRLIRDKAELEGTAYFEFLPGHYSEKHWNETSVFLDEEVMCMIERPFMNTMPGYDHYSFSDVAAPRWQSILEGLSKLKTVFADASTVGDVSEQFCCIWPGTVKSFEKDFDVNRNRLIVVIDDFTDWVEQTLHEHESIAVLGM